MRDEAILTCSSLIPHPYTLTFQQILADLKKKQYQPVYFLHGAEAYFIDAISDFIEENALPEGERSFNQVVLYGKEIDHLTVVDNARRYPMMSPFQVVIVKEAQEMKDLKDLDKYVEKPMPTTVLVICHKHKAFNANTKFGKLLKEKSVFFESKKLYDNQVPDWISDYLRSKSLKISPATAELLGEYLGTDLSIVVNELDKLALNVPKGVEVTAQLVEEHVGISREYNIFELQKAIGNRDFAKTARIVQNFTANPKKNPLIVITSSLVNFFIKVYSLHFLKNAHDNDVQKALNLRSTYALKDYRAAVRNYPLAKTEQIINILKTVDLQSKGVDYNSVGKEDGELLKEMVFKILH